MTRTASQTSTEQIDQYAVMGNPIAHSKSPLIHAAFAAQTAQNLHYSAMLAPQDGFVASVQKFRQQGGQGLNVTVPFKTQAFHLADELNEAASRAEAVNTLSFVDNKILGANTDGIGLVRDLQNNHQISLHNQRILILGAGGAVQGILQPLLATKPQLVMIANRTVEKATHLAKRFQDLGDIQGGGFRDIQASFDLIINGTAASLEGIVPPIPDHCLAEQGICYDMMYAKQDTAFVTWGKQHHAQASLDGLGMLVEQAAESFRLWRGVTPKTSAILHDLRG
ncbi:MAG: shikimate dehydrogenase [bacterium]